jgi:dipeptidyl-peptidase-4
MHKIITFLLLSFSLSIGAQQNITIEDFSLKGTFRARGIDDFTPLADGKHYLSQKDEFIVLHNVSDGKAVDTLIRPGKRGVPSDFVFDSYEVVAADKYILLATGSEKIYRHSYMAQYYLYSIKEKLLIPVSLEGKQMMPQVSPDGKNVAFVRGNNIYINELDRGFEHAVTTDGKVGKIINGAPDWAYEEEFTLTKALWWSPDSKKLAWIRFDESQVPEYEMTVYGSYLYPYISKFKYPKVGQNNSEVSVHYYDVSSKTSHEFNTQHVGTDYIPRVFWNPSSNTVAVLKLNRLQNKLDILMCGTDGSSNISYTEKAEKYLTEPTDKYLFFLSDGRYVIQSERYGTNQMLLIGTDGKEIRLLSNIENEVTDVLGVDEKNEKVYYQAVNESALYTGIYVASIDKCETHLLTPKLGTNEAIFSPDFSYFIHTWSSANEPDCVTLCRKDGKSLRVLEDNQILKQKAKALGLPQKTFFQLKSADSSTLLNAWMIRPNDFDPSKKYPVLMYVYGGPGIQTVTDSWGVDWYYYLAQKGYIVVSVDGCGTGHRGAAFRNCTYKNLGIKESDDQIAAARYLAQMTYVDSSRIGIYGWSYGGYMSSMCLFRGDGVFRAIAAVAPVTDWRFYDSIYTERYMGLPDDNADGYNKSSVFQYIKPVKAKFLLVHGTADDNVHFQNTADLSAKMIDAGIQFDTQIYPDKDHGIRARTHLYNRLVNFFTTNL